MQTQTAVRRLRKSLRFTQRELAELLGVGQGAVSRIEAGGMPEADHVFALNILFDQSPPALFAGRYEVVGDALAGRAAELERKLQAKRSRASSHKRQWLREMIGRITVTPA